jgi:hypothetical protein
VKLNIPGFNASFHVELEDVTNSHASISSSYSDSTSSADDQVPSLSSTSTTGAAVHSTRRSRKKRKPRNGENEPELVSDAAGNPLQGETSSAAAEIQV